MDSTQSDADKIRAKRLAKLGGQNSTSPPQQPQQDGAADAVSPSPTTSATQHTEPAAEKQQSPSMTRDNPFSQLAAQAEPDKKPATTQITVKPRLASPTKRERDGSNRPRSRPTDRAPESLEIWIDRNYRQILRASVKREETRDAHGNNLIYLEATKDDLLNGKLGKDDFEAALTEAASAVSRTPGAKVFKYLLQCFKRVSRAIRGAKYSGPEDEKQEVLKEARRLCMSYAIFAVTMPEIFGENVPTSNQLVEHLLAEPECDVGICTDFLNEASSRFEEDESIKDTIVGAAEELSRQLAQKSMLDEYLNYVRGLRNLLRFPKIVDAVTQSPLWAPSGIQAQDIETKTLLGPFFRLSPMQQDVASSYFSAPRTRDGGFIQAAQTAVRMTLRTHQDELFMIADTIVRAGTASRERMLNWFALCTNLNHKKRAMRVDWRIVSTDGFMVNVTTTLDRLCEPFMDARFGKIEKIDVDYLRRNPRVDISDETKINADQNTSDEFYANRAEGANNFISEVFFLTVAAHHYGTEAAQTRMSTLSKTAKRMEKDLEAMESERHKYIHNPRYLERFEAALAKTKKQIDDMWSTIHATHGVLLDDLSQARSVQFMRYVIVWILRIASRQNLPKEALQLPLPSEQPDVFKCLPEYLVEDIVDNFKFITSNMPHIITPHQCEEILHVCVTFLRSSEYIKNPGVKSGLVTILFYGVHRIQSRPNGVLGDLLIGSEFAHKHLLHALMKFYIEAESTGTHTQFFDKFNIRYEIFQVIKRIWINTMYRENLAKEARVNTDFFVQFVNMLLNDATFVLDEVLSSFKKINELSKELEDPSIMQDLNEEQRKEKQELLEDHKRRAKSYMQLTRETMETLILFTETLADSFTMKEIVQRLADMLDYNLDILTDTDLRKNIKVENPEEYGFDAKRLLGDIMSVYINLAAKSSFIEAIAKDERSYKPANFAEATRLMKKYVIKSPEELATWEEFGKKVAEQKTLLDEEEEELGEIPEEFEDPLMASLMTDPVLLPSSKQIVDRSTIRAYLLSDPIDPFNRMPLKMEDVMPDAALKERIEEWRAQKKAERKANKMDTSTG